MCSITFLPQPSDGGYLVLMNRDEQRHRVRALPPERFAFQSVNAIYPREPEGGTWIAATDTGIVLALMNWSIQPLFTPARSRGLLIPHILRHGVEDPPERALAGLPLQTFNAFRLLRFCLGLRTIEEFRWDGKTAQLLNPPWILSHWFSSGFDEPGVTSARMDAALMARKDPDIGSPAWARRLHSGHYPDKGAYSICMHRFDARTVSQTEIQIQSQETTMIYTEGAPCAHGTRSFRMVMRQGDGQTES